MQLSLLLACTVALAPIVIASSEEYYPEAGLYARDFSPDDSETVFFARNVNVKPRMEGYLDYYRRSADPGRHGRKKVNSVKNSNQQGATKPKSRRQAPGNNAKSPTTPTQPTTKSTKNSPASSKDQHPFHLFTADPGKVTALLQSYSHRNNATYVAAGGLKCDSTKSKLASWLELNIAILYTAKGDPKTQDSEWMEGLFSESFPADGDVPPGATVSVVWKTMMSACKYSPDPNTEGKKLVWNHDETPRNFGVKYEFAALDTILAEHPDLVNLKYRSDF
ncbi:hypothetical protein MMC17_004900 [Xylographa soralifera]|nr:hypothetical protein [Xylographa soralifera]